MAFFPPSQARRPPFVGDFLERNEENSGGCCKITKIVVLIISSLSTFIFLPWHIALGFSSSATILGLLCIFCCDDDDSSQRSFIFREPREPIDPQPPVNIIFQGAGWPQNVVGGPGGPGGRPIPHHTPMAPRPDLGAREQKDGDAPRPRPSYSPHDSSRRFVGAKPRFAPGRERIDSDSSG